MMNITTKALMAFLALSLLVTSTRAEDTLFSGHSLSTNNYLENGPYKFIMQSDCNLVLYVNKNRALWSSGTYGKGTNCYAKLQDNGDLVVFSGIEVIWTSGTAPGPNSYRLVVQSDGNVVIYGAALWATNTVQSRKRLL